MKLTIVYDNKVYLKGYGLQSDWGFACIIKTAHESILFDTGAKGTLLLQNMLKLDIHPKDINKIFISHEHWDHNGGLATLLSDVADIEIYRLENKEIWKNNTTTIIQKPVQISKGVYSTGRLRGVPIDEQAMILKEKKGLFLVVGCCHFSIRTLLQHVKPMGNITGIIGGFHGFKEYRLLKDLDYICPCHCTAHKKELKKAFPDKNLNCGVGKIIDLNQLTEQ